MDKKGIKKEITPEILFRIKSRGVESKEEISRHLIRQVNNENNEFKHMKS